MAEARYLAFLETIQHLRPSLHRYCARMTGSVLDGEDVVQEALFAAYRKLESYDDSRPMKPWLFRIAHNRCVDVLRQRGIREEAEAVTVEDVTDEPVPTPMHAIEYLVYTLPPKERASVLLKDVFDYSLQEIAELVDSTIGGVKAALNRGRSKLAEQPVLARTPTSEDTALVRMYVDRFNRHDWDAVRELISADAKLLVADRYVGRLDESPYFGVYEKLPNWHFIAGEIDGEAVVIIEQAGVATGVVRFRITDGKIVDIGDFWYCPWLLDVSPST